MNQIRNNLTKLYKSSHS